MKAFLLISCFWFFAIVKSSINAATSDEIVFGSFGKDDEMAAVSSIASEDKSAAAAVEVTSAVEVMAPAFIQYTSAPIRGDRLNELKKAEKSNHIRFSGVSAIPGRLALRLARDYSITSLRDYSIKALYVCLQYLELPSNLKADPGTKASTLKSLFKLGRTAHQGLDGLKNSFLHPICFEAMKYLGDALENDQIDWMVENVPVALFDNFELITSLKDYSFLDAQVHDQLRSYTVAAAVDFLSIPAFVRTAPVDLLMIFLSTLFEPSRHWNILLENRGLPTLLEDQNVGENPLYYSFLVGIGYPEYILDATGITGKIRSDGMSIAILASLIAYIQETNEAIYLQMTEIATIWADLHKNSHLNATLNVNEEFNSRVLGPLKNLQFAKEQREDVNKLIKEFEEAKLNVDPFITKTCPDWLRSLKILAQTPFNAMMRSSFASRCSSHLMTYIHPDDEGNVIKLPRLTPVNSSELHGIFLGPDPAYIFSPFLWSSLWRNVFHQDGDKFEVIYRDNNFNTIDLIGAWTKLSLLLPEIFCKGPRLQSFIASVSISAPPKGFELPRDQLIQRKVFTKKVIAALKDNVRLVDKASIELIKLNLSDSEELVHVTEELSKIFHDGPQCAKISIATLEDFCLHINTMIYHENAGFLSIRIFLYLKMMEASFASLGKTLADDQIKSIGESREINKFLAKHGRALSRTQVDGLLKTDLGRMFLKSNKPMLRSLSDYSSFNPKDFEDLEISVDEIELNLATASTSAKLLSLNKKGFSNVNDPLALVYSLGTSLWTDPNNFKNLALWELLNPLVLAYDLNMTTECSFIHHMTGLKHKLHGKVLLEMTLVFVLKWLIAQDWYAFVYHMALAKGAEYFGPEMISRLKEVYRKYLIEGEIPGRKDLNDWLRIAEDCRCANEETREEIINALVGLGVAVDCAPLTPYREIINQSTSNVAGLLSMPFRQQIHSSSLLAYVKILVSKYFKANDKVVWLARLEILSQFAPETGALNHGNSSSMARFNLEHLPTSDALIYKWALEFGGVCVETIFRDPSRPDLEITIQKPKAKVEPVTNKKKANKKK